MTNPGVVKQTVRYHHVFRFVPLQNPLVLTGGDFFVLIQVLKSSIAHP